MTVYAAGPRDLVMVKALVGDNEFPYYTTKDDEKDVYKRDTKELHRIANLIERLPKMTKRIKDKYGSYHSLLMDTLKKEGFRSG